MRRIGRWLLPPALLFAIVVLVLSLRERDQYESGALLPPADATVPGDDPSFRALLPSPLVHACPTCGECTHALDVLENRRTFRLLDEDGWYKLFWAGDETYHYEDPIVLAACLRNSTARDPRGRWTLRARVGRATHGALPPHECSAVPGEIFLSYELVVSPEPIGSATIPVPGTSFQIARTLELFAYRYGDVPHLPSVLHFGWKLEEPAAAAAGAPCACGKP
jgi:hypothetical protein